MIVIGVSSTVFIIVMVFGVLAYVHDGAQAVRRRSQRKRRATEVYGSETSSKER
jgi:hypothetical protein